MPKKSGVRFVLREEDIMELTRGLWTQSDYDEFTEYLISLSDEKYKSFSDSLVPGFELSYGIRVPLIRQTARLIAKGDYNGFLSCKKGGYREEIMLEGIVMSLIKCDYAHTLAYMKEYTYKINSWDTCDTVTFKNLKNRPHEFLDDAAWFIRNGNPWAQRFGFLHLMSFYLTDEYIDRVFEYVNSVNSDFYYVQMMQAWLVATAAAKCRDKTMEFLADNDLNKFTRNKAIQKMRESYRISPEDKEYILKFKS